MNDGPGLLVDDAAAWSIAVRHGISRVGCHDSSGRPGGAAPDEANNVMRLVEAGAPPYDVVRDRRLRHEEPPDSGHDSAGPGRHVPAGGAWAGYGAGGYSGDGSVPSVVDGADAPGRGVLVAGCPAGASTTRLVPLLKASGGAVIGSTASDRRAVSGRPRRCRPGASRCRPSTQRATRRRRRGRGAPSWPGGGRLGPRSVKAWSRTVYRTGRRARGSRTPSPRPVARSAACARVGQELGADGEGEPRPSTGPAPTHR